MRLACCKQERAAGLVNGVLRRFIREKAELLKRVDESLAARTAHPQWLVDEIQDGVARPRRIHPDGQQWPSAHGSARRPVPHERGRRHRGAGEDRRRGQGATLGCFGCRAGSGCVGD